MPIVLIVISKTRGSTDDPRIIHFCDELFHEKVARLSKPTLNKIRLKEPILYFISEPTKLSWQDLAEGFLKSKIRLRGLLVSNN